MIGAIVFATDQGLGYLAKSFYDNGVIDRVLVVEHSSRKNHYDWYPDRVRTEAELLNGLTTLLMFETPFNWKVIPRARELGIKTVLMPMYECTNFPFPYEPDLLITPSDLDQQFYQTKNCVRLNVPVDVRWTLRKTAEVFVHNAGNGGLGGRNGTREVLEAMKHVKSPVKLIIRTQVGGIHSSDPRIEIRQGTFDDIWAEGDVFLFPEKFNGLSLPLQEAFASGMAVMAGNRFPMNTWLPNEMLVPVEKYTKERIAVEFDCAQYNPRTIAKQIDDWYGTDITQYSLKGRDFAEKNSWKKLKPKYEKILS